MTNRRDLLRTLAIGGALLTAGSASRAGIPASKHPRAIAMWDFSWIERRWPGAGYEDWDQALDELVERGYDAVRIDAFPHLIAVDPNRIWTIHSDGQDGDWGAPGEVDIDRLGEKLVGFIARCRSRGVLVGLSTWYKRD